MGFFDFLRPKYDRTANYTDEGRAIGTEATRLRGELNKTKHEYSMMLEKLEFEKRKLELENSISELREEAAEYDEDFPEAQGEESADSLLIKALAPLLLKNVSPATLSSPPPAGVVSTPAPGEPTDAELREIWNKLPEEYRAQARGMVKK